MEEKYPEMKTPLVSVGNRKCKRSVKVTYAYTSTVKTLLFVGVFLLY